MKREMHSALVVCTRRIGDVLLATPVVRSLKAAYPSLAVDMLVFEGTQQVVSALPEIRRTLTVHERPALTGHLALLRSLWRRYDVALSVLAGDRPTFYAWVAGRYRIGTLLPERKSRWKRVLLDRWIPFDNVNTHTIAMNLALLDPLQIRPIPTPVVSWRPDDEKQVCRLLPGVDCNIEYAVLHVSPKFVYKSWTVAGWAELGHWLLKQGFTVVITGGSSPEELAYATELSKQLPASAVNLAGRVELPALGYLLSRATIYVGTDTAVSHMAAATGVPTVALFGPSNPVKWGPWPSQFPLQASSPWKVRGSQRQGNVYLLQGTGDCVPCFHEGCDRHIASLSDCLQQLPGSRVIQAVEFMLAESAAGRVSKPAARVGAGSLGSEDLVK